MVCLAATLTGGGVTRSIAQTPPPADPRPNFVFVLTDDQRWDTVGRCTGGFDGHDLNAGVDSCMPQLQHLLMRNGVTFKRGYVTTSVCCPSRASILTGQYARHTRVVDNGAYQHFNESSTLATWLDAAGYRTAHYGKYMNGYGDPRVTPPLHVPPGWDTWRMLWNGNSNTGYRAYTLIEKIDGSAPALNDYDSLTSTSDERCAAGNYYSTDNWCRMALEFLRSDRETPFYLQFSSTAPHLPAQAARRHTNRFGSVPTPTYPSYNAAPSPNPPSWMPTSPLDGNRLTLFEREFRAMLDANLAVDDAIGELYRELQSDGRLDNTVFIFMSDNGFARAEHRYDNKGCAYEECHLVPLVIACPPAVCPGAQANTVDDQNLVLNIDLAPTIAELAGATPTLTPDGRSLVPLLNGDAPTWRSDFLLEDQGTYILNQPLGIMQDRPDGHTYKYVKYQRNSTNLELYDLTVDPWELNNLAGDGIHTAIENDLAARLNEIFLAPTVGITSGPTSTIASNIATFTWSSNEHARFECAIDSTTLEPCGEGTTGTATFEGLSLTSHTFRVRGIDNDNNTSNTAGRVFTASRDTTPPPAPRFTVTPTDPSLADGSFEFTAESGATLACSLDGAAFTPCTSPFAFDNLDAGPHGFAVTAADGAGNISEPATFAWSVDLGVPDPPTITQAPVDVSSTEVTFSFEHPQNVRFECSLDASAFGECTPPHTYRDLAEGPHAFEVRAVNGAGTASDPVRVGWTVVDTTAPVPPTLTETPAATSRADVTFAFTHDEAGVAFSCALDADPYAPCRSPVAYALTSGVHTFHVRATDGAGNDSTPTTYQWEVDTTPPAPPTFTVTPDAVSDTSTSFGFSGESEATFECALDGAAFTTCTSPHDLASLGLGNHTFEVRTIDTVGNVSLPSSYAWVVEDLTPLAAPIITGFPNDPSRGSAIFEFRHDEPGTTFRCALDSDPLADCSSPASYSGLAEGAHEFSVVAIDTAGASSDAARFAWTVDLTAPAPPALTFTSLLPDNSEVRFEFTSGEPGATFDCALDAAGFTPCSSPHSLAGLTGGGHAFRVRAVDAAGNGSTPSEHSWIVDTGDATPPTVTLNGNADSLVPQLTTGAAWSGSDDVGITRYELFRRTGTQGVVEQMTLSSPTATNFIFTGTRGATYCFEVLAYDAAANVGSSGERCRAVPYDDRSSQIGYSAGATQEPGAGAFDGTLSVLDAAGEEATFTFTGRRFGILARQSPSSGIAELTLDGAFLRNVDFYSASTRDRVYVWQQQVTDTTHTLTIRWTGTRNAASTGASLSLDGMGAISQGAPVSARVQQR